MPSVKSRSFVTFVSDLKIFSVSVFFTVFTWSLINSLKVNVITPALLGLFEADKDTGPIVFPVRDGNVIKLGLFLIDVFQWGLILIITYIIWRIYQNVPTAKIVSAVEE